MPWTKDQLADPIERLRTFLRLFNATQHDPKSPDADKELVDFACECAAFDLMEDPPPQGGEVPQP